MQEGDAEFSNNLCWLYLWPYVLQVILACPQKSHQAGLACFHPKLDLGNASSLYINIFAMFQQVSNLIKKLIPVVISCHSSVLFLKQANWISM